ncbi:hypothetical protein [Streptomyces phaeoluteigriseus]|uniref:hypothetical protein n=1 Tax=Streptomyces phaeoluteigriseus TaxID=114686 RepID=UPI0036BF7E44
MNTVTSDLRGREARQALDEVGLATDKQLVPDGTLPAQRTSGVRLGPLPRRRPGVVRDAEMVAVADLFVRALRNCGDAGDAGYASDRSRLPVVGRLPWLKCGPNARKPVPTRPRRRACGWPAPAL